MTMRTTFSDQKYLLQQTFDCQGYHLLKTVVGSLINLNIVLLRYGNVFITMVFIFHSI